MDKNEIDGDCKLMVDNTTVLCRENLFLLQIGMIQRSYVALRHLCFFHLHLL